MATEQISYASYTEEDKEKFMGMLSLEHTSQTVTLEVEQIISEMTLSDLSMITGHKHISDHCHRILHEDGIDDFRKLILLRKLTERSSEEIGVAFTIILNQGKIDQDTIEKMQSRISSCLPGRELKELDSNDVGHITKEFISEGEICQGLIEEFQLALGIS